MRPDRAIKQITAYDPVARFTAAKVFSAASAGCAANFLDKVLNAFPFPIKGVQSLPPAKAGVDGGSEFMAEFEQACKDKGIALFVLPPNGPISTAPSRALRAHGATNSMRVATCRIGSIVSMSISTPSLTSITLIGHTAHLPEKPAEYFQQRRAAETPPSHMC